MAEVESSKITTLEFTKMKKSISQINKMIKSYIPEYNAKIFKSFEDNIARVTIRVVGQGDIYQNMLEI